jgi:hypothetical protein
MDVVDNILEDFPYDTLKSRLLETHTLSDHEKLEVLYKFEHLGGRRPSQMIASMLPYCLAGMEQTIMFQLVGRTVHLNTAPFLKLVFLYSTSPEPLEIPHSLVQTF